jgi:hypothetical protein
MSSSPSLLDRTFITREMARGWPLELPPDLPCQWWISYQYDTVLLGWMKIIVQELVFSQITVQTKPDPVHPVILSQEALLVSDIAVDWATRAMFNFDTAGCADMLFADTVKQEEYAPGPTGGQPGD